jgi:hypothetical protein
MLTDEIAAAATAAELRRHGSGLAVILGKLAPKGREREGNGAG